ncbi:hypothetical protein QS257_02545 [Terrilactibacillus sp. S3-3]|nr:hypothetical protein QS257_02545 [Terrilactibacillus sp. S3-3]
MPPIEYQAEEVLKDVKAVLAVLFDPAHSFDTYVKFDFATKKTIPLVKKNFFNARILRRWLHVLPLKKRRRLPKRNKVFVSPKRKIW